MRILLTGATGYLGAEILAELLAHEEISVVAWGRNEKRLEVLQTRFGSDSHRLTLETT